MRITKISLLCLGLFFFHTKLIGQNNYVDSLKQQLASAKDDTTRLYILNSLSKYYTYSKVDTALLYAQQGLLLSKKTNSKRQEILALFFYGEILRLNGDYPKSADLSLQALRLAEKNNDGFLLFNIYQELLELYSDEGDYNNAALYKYKLKKAFEIFNRYPQHYLRSIGRFYEKFNLLDSALIVIKKAIELDSTWSILPYILGNIYFKKDNYPLAIYYYKTGIKLAISDDYRNDQMDIYNGIARTFMKTRLIDSCIYYAKQTILVGKSYEYPIAVLEASNLLSGIYKSQHATDSLIKYMELAASVKENIFSQKKNAEVQNLSFNEQLRQQEMNATQEKYRNKIKIFTLTGTVAACLIIAFLLLRNNRHKQKANAELQQRNNEIRNTLLELKATQSQLIQSEKMASLGDLTAGIAHEIQNPLNFVNNFSEVNKELLVEMKDEMNKGNLGEANSIANNVIDNEQKINHHGKRADAIVKGMLQHSRSSSGVKEPTDINALADEYFRLAYHGLRAKDKSYNAIMKTDYDKSIGNISIIPQDIGRVLLNLINNAFYAVNEKKKQQSDGYEPTVSVSVKKSGDKVLIFVKDNGNGIPQKVLDKIFQPFFTTKPTGQGTGLGLSLSYDIVKAHGGEIKVNTREGEFTDFVVQLSI
jgi:signal transduction histidine kinase